MHLLGYKINGGNLTGMTPLQKIVSNIITQEILKLKIDNTPFLTL